MRRLCEVTHKKPTKEQKAAFDLKKRKIDVPEMKTAVRLSLSSEGVKLLKDAGGLVKFLQEGRHTLSPRLSRLQKMWGLEPKEAVKQEAKQAHAPVEESVAETTKT